MRNPLWSIILSGIVFIGAILCIYFHSGKVLGDGNASFSTIKLFPDRKDNLSSNNINTPVVNKDKDDNISYKDNLSKEMLESQKLELPDNDSLIDNKRLQEADSNNKDSEDSQIIDNAIHNDDFNNDNIVVNSSADNTTDNLSQDNGSNFDNLSNNIDNITIE